MMHCVPAGGGELAGSRGGLLVQHTAAPLLPHPTCIVQESALRSQNASLQKSGRVRA